MDYHPVEPQEPTTPHLPQWIERARQTLSKEVYLKSALAVALELTNQLLHITCSLHPPNNEDDDDIISGINSSLPDTVASSWRRTSSSLTLDQLDIKLDDIKTDNVIVHMSNHMNMTDIQDACIQPPEREFSPGDIFDAPLLLPEDVCFALGKILLDLFSECIEPLLMIDLRGEEEEEANNDSFGDLVKDIHLKDLHLVNEGLLWDEDDDGNLIRHRRDDDRRDDRDDLRATKKTSLAGTSRTSSSTTTASSSTKVASKALGAKKLLQEQGLPLSLCNLVADLMEKERANQFMPDTASLITLEEVYFELMRMKAHPHRFLFDQTCPRTALENTALFNQSCPDEVYGRDREMNTLMNTAKRISDNLNPSPQSARNFLCQAVFLSGPSGMGKSSVTNKFTSYCQSRNWFVLMCRFAKDVAPLTILLQAVNTFFESFVTQEQENGELKRSPALHAAWNGIAFSIIDSIDNSECFGQLRELVPNFNKLFPVSSTFSTNCEDSLLAKNAVRTSSPGPVGSGKNRLLNLIRIIFKAICSGGCPVLVCAEDLHWCDKFTLDILGEFIQSDVSFPLEDGPTRGGLLLLSTYRDDEVDDDGIVMTHIKGIELSKGPKHVCKVSLGALEQNAINEMISFKLCLPLRQTRQLALLVHQRTQGQPLFTIEFLRTIVQRNLLQFSIRDRRWLWNENVIDDPGLLSECVAELLTKKLARLPPNVIESLEVLSCISVQVNEKVVQLLDQAQILPSSSSILESLLTAVHEGVVVKANSMFVFSHEAVRAASYSLIPANKRMFLHKRIGTCLAGDSAVSNIPELCTLAVDQANIVCKNGGHFETSERDLFARLNLEAGKHSMSCSNFEQGRRYFEAGISMLHGNAWAAQYSICLELYEMSILVSFMDGKIDNCWDRIQVILSNAKTFKDTLTVRVLRAKFLVYKEQYDDATNDVLKILSQLGEDFPSEISTKDVVDEIRATQPLVDGIKKEDIANLPMIADETKLMAMKFMGLLITFCNYASPMLVHLLSCRMIQRTFQFGYCEESISGLVFMSTGLMHFSDDHWLATRVNRIAELLTAGHPNEHSIKARLTPLSVTTKAHVEPYQAVADCCREGYRSAITIGDVDSAMLCGITYCIADHFVSSNIIDHQKAILKHLKQFAEHKQRGLLRSCMTFLNSCVALSGNQIESGVQVESNKELYEVAEQTKNSFLMHHVMINQMEVHCIFREYLACANLGQKYPKNAKRALDYHKVFYEGIAALCLARDTKQSFWKEIGEKSLIALNKLVLLSSWNFENKHSLLQAELHYLNGRQSMAELSYQCSILSAREHRFYFEEALATELFGIYFVETERVEEGLKHLVTANELYAKWGAMKKVEELGNFIDMIKQPLTGYGRG